MAGPAVGDLAQDPRYEPAAGEPGPEPGSGPGTEPGSRRRRRRRGRRIAVALLVLAGAGAAAFGLGPGLGGRTPAGKEANDLPPSTAKVARQTLEDSRTEAGELGYGPTSTAVSKAAGTLTKVPESGTVITRGKALYAVDDKPVTLLYGSMPAYRPLKEGAEGADVEQLEKNLWALGYTGFTVDDEYTGLTAEAVRDWQDDLGLKETGVVDLGQVVFARGAVRVDSLQAKEGDTVAPGGKVLDHTGTTKAVTVGLDVEDQRLAKEGGKVTVTLPDNTAVQGRIDDVTTIIEPGSGEQETKTKVEVIVALDGKKAQKAADAYALASVDVSFTAEKRKGVLTVPVAALVALREGGFGVEVVKGSTTRYVAVETGLFAGGRVEITGDGIAEGTTVGIPN